VPHSGWPFNRQHLDPFYSRASKFLELGSDQFDVAYYLKQDPELQRLAVDESVFFHKMWQFSAPTRVGTVYRDPIVNAANVHLYTYAKAVELVPNAGVTAIDGVRAKTIDGKEHRVRARHYVIACGAIHNARLLLASNSVAKQGVGNANDLVGRYFMEHFEIVSAEMTLETPPASFRLFQYPGRGRKGQRAELALQGAIQRKHRILNGTASPSPQAKPGGALNSRFSSFSADAEVNVKQQEAQSARGAAAGPNRGGGGAPNTATLYRMFTRQEQAPNPDSRVLLSAERDALGMPLADLQWRMTPLDKRSIRVFYELLGQELGRAKLGRVQMGEWLLDGDDMAWPTHLSAGWHNMGTTRMHKDPKQGVVDANAKIHGIANLFCAGGSVYPTGGAVNPTLTLVALSIRLADHLKKVVV
jgi:choline dehydrogenase-like flavoprotein